MLEAVLPDLRYRAVAPVAADTFRRVRLDWQIFVEERIATYLEGVERVEAAVAAAVDAHATRIAALVKALTDAMLAGVGVVVGAFIGAALADPFEDRLFVLSMLVYAVYVGVFLLLVGLAAARGDAQQADAAFALQRAQLERSIGQPTVEAVVGDRVRAARLRFDQWWAVCLMAYGGVAGAAVAAAGLVPGMV